MYVYIYIYIYIHMGPPRQALPLCVPLALCGPPSLSPTLSLSLMWAQ